MVSHRGMITAMLRLTHLLRVKIQSQEATAIPRPRLNRTAVRVPRAVSSQLSEWRRISCYWCPPPSR